MQQRGRGQVDGHHVAAHAEHLDVFAHPERLGEDDREPGHQVAEHALQREAEADAGHAEAGHQGRHLEAEVVEGDQDREQHDDDAQHAYQEHPHGRLHGAPAEALVDETADPAADEETGDQDDERAEHLDAVAGGETDDETLDVHGGSFGKGAP